MKFLEKEICYICSGNEGKSGSAGIRTENYNSQKIHPLIESLKKYMEEQKEGEGVHRLVVFHVEKMGQEILENTSAKKEELYLKQNEEISILLESILLSPKSALKNSDYFRKKSKALCYSGGSLGSDGHELLPFDSEKYNKVIDFIYEYYEQMLQKEYIDGQTVFYLFRALWGLGEYVAWINEKTGRDVFVLEYKKLRNILMEFLCDEIKNPIGFYAIKRT